MVFVMYICVQIVGYIGYGEGTPGNLAEALAADFPLVGIITSTGILVNCLIAAPMFIYVILNSFENLGTSSLHTTGTAPNRIFRVALMAFLCVSGYLAPNIGAVISLVSAVFCVCNNIFLPLLFYYMVRKRHIASAIDTEPINVFKRAIHVITVVVGVLTMLFGVKGALASCSCSHSHSGSQTATAAATAAATATPTVQ